MKKNVFQISSFIFALALGIMLSFGFNYVVAQLVNEEKLPVEISNNQAKEEFQKKLPENKKTTYDIEELQLIELQGIRTDLKNIQKTLWQK